MSENGKLSFICLIQGSHNKCLQDAHLRVMGARSSSKVYDCIHAYVLVRRKKMFSYAWLHQNTSKFSLFSLLGFSVCNTHNFRCSLTKEEQYDDVSEPSFCFAVRTLYVSAALRYSSFLHDKRTWTSFSLNPKSLLFKGGKKSEEGNSLNNVQWVL